MIVKRTKDIKTARAFAKWVQNYVDENQKHVGKDLGDLGIGIGKNYFTERPIGAITAHGYVRERLEKLRLAQGLKGNEAILRLVKDHCRSRKLRKRKIYALRCVMSLDPAKTTKLAQDKVDIDRLLIRSIEEAFAEYQKKFYPGDRVGYIVGIHHDGITNALNKPRLPHIHAHVAIFPQTDKGLRVSLSNHNMPGRDGEFREVLDDFRSFYVLAIEQNLNAIAADTPAEPDPDWVAFCNCCAARVLLESSEQVEVPKYSLSETFLKEVTRADPDRLRGTSTIFRNTFYSLKRRFPSYTPLDCIQTAKNEMLTRLEDLHGSVKAQQIPAGYQIRNERNARIWDFRLPKGIHLKKPTGQNQSRTPSRKQNIENFFKASQDRRFAEHVLFIGSVALTELHMCMRCSTTATNPDWFETVEAFWKRLRPMPNKLFYQPELPPNLETANPRIIATNPAPQKPTEPVAAPEADPPDMGLS